MVIGTRVVTDMTTDTKENEMAEVTPNFKPGAKKAAGSTKQAPAKTAAKKATAKKAAAKKTTGVVRAKSVVTKEGTQKDAFTGEELPITQFPTVRNKDGVYERGTVARKNLEAWRNSRKAEREAAKAKKDADKAAAKAAKDAEKAAEKAAAAAAAAETEGAAESA